MDLLRTVFDQVGNGFRKLCATHDRVIDENELLVLDDREHRYQLHLSDEISGFLVLRHEAPRPGRRVFDQRTRVRHAGAICISQCVSRTAVRYACNVIHIKIIVLFCQKFSVAVSHLLYIAAFIDGRGISEIRPEKCADPHSLLRFAHCFVFIRSQESDLSRSQLSLVFISDVDECKGFGRGTVRTVFMADDQRRSAVLVTSRVKPFSGEHQDRH